MYLQSMELGAEAPSSLRYVYLDTNVADEVATASDVDVSSTPFRHRHEQHPARSIYLRTTQDKILKARPNWPNSTTALRHHGVTVVDTLSNDAVVTISIAKDTYSHVNLL